jgi:hypothetical protein
VKPLDQKISKKRLKAFLAQYPEDPEPKLTSKQLVQQKFISSIRHSKLKETLDQLEKQPLRRKNAK